jgi:hypothetical protein
MFLISQNEEGFEFLLLNDTVLATPLLNRGSRLRPLNWIELFGRVSQVPQPFSKLFNLTSLKLPRFIFV